MQDACQKNFPLFQLLADRAAIWVRLQGQAIRPSLPAFLAVRALCRRRRRQVEYGVSLRHCRLGTPFRFHEMLTITFIHSG
jgi:hypothetical protein